MATFSAGISDNKVGIMTMFGFHWAEFCISLKCHPDEIFVVGWRGSCHKISVLEVTKISSTCTMLNSHYSDVMIGTMASQITSLTAVYSTDYSGADQRKHQSSASLAFVWGIHRGPVNSPHKWPITRKIFPFDDVIMSWESALCLELDLTSPSIKLQIIKP